MNREKLIQFIEEKLEEYQYGLNYEEDNYNAGFTHALLMIEEFIKKEDSEWYLKTSYF